MKSTLIDAGPVIALFDKSDQFHKQVMTFMATFEGRLISTWPVLTEVCCMLDFNPETQIDFLDWVTLGGIDIHNIEQWQLNSIREKLKTYTDLPADFADCTLLEVAESENISSIITLDSDFSVYKLNNGDFLNSML